MSEKLNQQQIQALISLLDDSDKEIYNEIESKLLSLGKEVIPILEDFWGNSFDAVLQGRIEQIVHKIQFESLLVLSDACCLPALPWHCLLAWQKPHRLQQLCCRVLFS
jgi:hypothetical protein